MTDPNILANEDSQTWMSTSGVIASNALQLSGIGSQSSSARQAPGRTSRKRKSSTDFYLDPSDGFTTEDSTETSWTQSGQSTSIVHNSTLAPRVTIPNNASFQNLLPFDTFNPENPLWWDGQATHGQTSLPLCDDPLAYLCGNADPSNTIISGFNFPMPLAASPASGPHSSINAPTPRMINLFGADDPMLAQTHDLPDYINDELALAITYTGEEGYVERCSDSAQTFVPIAPKFIIPQHNAASSILPQSPIPSNPTAPEPPRKRKRFNEEGREKVKRVRKVGACFRCKIYKLEELPCAACLKVRNSQKVYRGPCVRLNMDLVHTFRAGDGDNGTVTAILPKYQWSKGSNTRTIELQWPFKGSAVKVPTLIMNCSEFQPSKEPVVEEFVVDGVVRAVSLPPWACRDAVSARKDVKKFMVDCQSLLEDEILQTLQDPIMLLTWTEVNRYRATYKSPLIDKAVQILAGAMMNSRYLRSVEANVFGVADEQSTPYFFDNLPLPPQLTYQIQTLIALVMMDTQAEILKNLKTRVYSKDRIQQWYELFLVIFILLATIEWVYQVQMRFVKAKEGVSERNHTNLSYVTQHMIDEWEASASNLIGHFHCVMNGQVPFDQEWHEESENSLRTGLDQEALSYIHNIKRETQERKEELESLRQTSGRFRLERPLSAICELFLPQKRHG